MADCLARCPSGSLINCPADMAFADCVGRELLVLAGQVISYWHWDVAATTIHPLYQEPMKASRRDLTRWDWKSPMYTFNAMVIDPKMTDRSVEEEGFHVEATMEIETMESIWDATTLPKPVEGDVMAIAGDFFDVVGVGGNQYFENASSVTTKISLKRSEDYLPDRRL